jgi:ABC-type polysaccharide/polyol phosphate transport system ATPase subunit
MIRVRNLAKAYGRRTIFESVSFDLPRGRKLGILGRNGAGKSTLIRIIGGAERPSAGRVERGMSVSWPLAFGGAFQTSLTGRDNVRFISRIYGRDFDHAIAAVDHFAELGPALREPVRTYSSGMRARLAFAVSMVVEFDCFLIDEIAAVGDARFAQKCEAELFAKRADRAMVIVSHDAAYVRDHCDHFAVLHDGHLRFHADFEEAYASFKHLIGWKEP